MWVLKILLRIYFVVAALCSMCFVSKCMAESISDTPLSEDNFIRIFRTEIPQVSDVPLRTDQEDFALIAWIAVLSVVGCLIFILCICCLWWKFHPKFTSRRQSSSAALVSNSSTVVTFQASTNGRVDVDLRNPAMNTENLRNFSSQGSLNFSFTSNFHDVTSNHQLEDGPPAYTTVISAVSPGNKSANAKFPQVAETKTVETPPPAYMTVAPFK